MTFAEARTQYVNYSGYEQDTTLLSVDMFLAAARALIVLMPSVMLEGGTVGFEKHMSIESLTEAIKLAVAYRSSLARAITDSSSDTGGVVQITAGSIYD